MKSAFFALLIASGVLDSAEPEFISQQISAQGAKSAVQQIFEDKKKLAQVLAGISTGSRSWLAVANQLHSAADAGASEQLALSVGAALEYRPENALSIAASEFGVDAICSGPDVDDARYDSYELAIGAIKKRQEMLRTISDQHLLAERDACIASLEKAKLGIVNFYERR